MPEPERKTHTAWVQVELEDATDEEASFFWEAIEGREVTTPGDEFAGVVVGVSVGQQPPD